MVHGPTQEPSSNIPRFQNNILLRIFDPIITHFEMRGNTLSCYRQRRESRDLDGMWIRGSGFVGYRSGCLRRIGRRLGAVV